jgi:hypothetical protein
LNEPAELGKLASFQDWHPTLSHCCRTS